MFFALASPPTDACDITVYKDAIPDDPKPFEFTGDLGAFTLDDDYDPTYPNSRFFEVEKGRSYIIKESAVVGWELADISCTVVDYLDNGEYSIQFGSDGTGWHDAFRMGDDRINITLGPEALAAFTCKFTNIPSSIPPEVIPQDPGQPLSVTKTADRPVASRGDEITYTIKVCNNGHQAATNVVVKDVMDKNVQIISAYPSLSSDGSWHISSLGPGDCATMTLTVYVPLEEVNFKMNQAVSGEGFVNVHTNYDTAIDPYTIRNCVNVISDGTKEISGCASVFVQGEAGTSLKRREHGSGSYASEDLTQLRSKNRSISTNTSLSALYAPTSFVLPKNQSINFTTRWIEKSKSKNWITGASMNEEYLYATRIDRDGSRELDENGSTMTTETEFVGVGHIGVLKRSEPDQTHPKAPPVFESGEDYVGSFRVYEKVDEYGKNVQSDRSVQGEGYVAVDRRIRDTQRTYESGTGSYDVDEMIRTHTSYIAKDIKALQGPGGYTYSPNLHSGSDLKWKEGLWSRSSNTTFRGGDLVFSTAPDGSYATYIGEEFSSADRLNKVSVAKGLNEMDSVASFSGRAAFRTILLPSFNNSTEKIDIAEEYAGQYEIARKILLTGVAKYDQPHISVIKEGRTILARYNGTSNAVLAEYRIIVTNDGSRALGPVYVKDLFPPGTRFINASVRPTEMAAEHASWMLTHLAVGGRSTIELMLNVTEEAAGDLVNRVEVAGGYDGRWVTGANFSAIEAAWLSCCPPEISLEKAAKADPDNPAIVSFTITVRNLASSAVAARITDYLPDGLTIIESSVEPSDYWQGRVVWTFSELGAGEVKAIEYKARALRDGSYTNRVHVDASSVEGDGSTYADAAASVVAGGSGARPYTTRYGGWQPPTQFGLNASEEGIQM